MDTLPIELLHYIAGHLPTMKDWFNFCCTCSLFAAIGRDQKNAAMNRLAVPAIWHYSDEFFLVYGKLANGKIHGALQDYRRGRLRALSQYREGALCGMHFKWHGNGQLEARTSYREGKRCGRAVRYHFNGTMSKSCYYQEGVKHGMCFHWNPQGELFGVGRYYKGQLAWYYGIFPAHQ